MELISEDRLEQQQQVHALNQHYEEPSDYLSTIISDLIKANQFTGVLDYGSGSGWLPKALTVQHTVNLRCYDPAIPRFSRPPTPEEFVVCLGVLEHIEPEHIDNVLDHLQTLTQKLLMISLSSGSKSDFFTHEGTRPLISEPTSWWLPKIVDRFRLDALMRTGDEFVILALPEEQ